MGTNWTRVVWGVTSVEFGEYLGGGQFGQVYAARYQGADAAAKTTRCPIGFPPSEIELMRRAQGSKRIVGLLGIETGTLWGTCIVMPLHPKGSLQQRVEACRPSRDEYLHYLQGICEGLIWLHSQSIVFNDLKPDNLLLDKENQVVLTDFGDARDARYCHTRQHPSEVGWGAPLYHAVPDCIAMQISVKSDI